MTASPALEANSGKYEGPFHAERIVEGDSSDLTALTLYKAGTDVEFELADGFFLVVTDIFIQIETAGDIALVKGSDAASNRIVYGHVAADTIIDRHLATPFVCEKEAALKFKGSASNKSSCIVEGYIRTA